MRHASGHDYRNSSFIVDVAMGQIGYHVPQNVFLVSVYYATKAAHTQYNDTQSIKQ